MRRWLTLLLIPYVLLASIAEIAEEQLYTLSPEELDQDWQLLSFFGHIKVIGKKDSPRYPFLILHMREVGLSEGDFELSPPISNAPKYIWSKVPGRICQDPQAMQGIAGCVLAHYELIQDTHKRYQKALKNFHRATPKELTATKAEVDRYSSVLIIEDNNAFGQLIEGVPYLESVGVKLRQTLSELPEDWDMFYLLCMHSEFGGPLAKQIPGCPRLLRATFGLTTKCFAVKCSAYEKLLQAYKKSLFHDAELLPADHIVASLHTSLNVYIAREPLAYRFACPSLVGSAPGINVAENHWQPWPFWEP